VEAEGGKIVFSKAQSIFDLAGKSKMTKDEAFRLLDKMREEG
jgi:pentatricopeptide repeat protein